MAEQTSNQKEEEKNEMENLERQNRGCRYEAQKSRVPVKHEPVLVVLMQHWTASQKERGGDQALQGEKDT